MHHDFSEGCSLTHRAYKGAEEKPFLLDNVWDLMHVIDYLSACKNVDPSRIGVTGISLGGMIAWLAAAVDKRITASAPLIGVHGFKCGFPSRVGVGGV